MDIFPLLRITSTICAICAVGACTQGAPSATAAASDKSSIAAADIGTNVSDDSAWQTNGGTACDKYITPDLVAEVLNMPAGKIEHTNPETCKVGAPDWHNPASIQITLGSHSNPGLFKATEQLRENLVPLPGVGDMATRSGNRTYVLVDALKGDHRSCSITAMVSSAPLKSELMAQKLGAICNELFALP